jgi:hypothetical protein
LKNEDRNAGKHTCNQITPQLLLKDAEFVSFSRNNTARVKLKKVTLFSLRRFSIEAAVLALRRGSPTVDPSEKGFYQQILET